VWLVTFMHYDLGYFDDETDTLEPIENPFGPKAWISRKSFAVITSVRSRSGRLQSSLKQRSRWVGVVR
jgi:hypothetical protein